MPLLGLGLWKTPREATRATVLAALRLGYRHLDGAWGYGNSREAGLGLLDALEEGTLRSREEIWVTSKLWCTAWEGGGKGGSGDGCGEVEEQFAYELAE